MNVDMALLVDWLAIVCLLTGAFLSFVASVGLIRFPDLLSRIHTAAKPQVLGLLLVLLGIGLRMAPQETGVFSVGTLLLVALFQIMTVPVAAHIVARVSYRTGRIRHGLLAEDELARDMALERGEEPAERSS